MTPDQFLALLDYIDKRAVFQIAAYQDTLDPEWSDLHSARVEMQRSAQRLTEVLGLEGDVGVRAIVDYML